MESGSFVEDGAIDGTIRGAGAKDGASDPVKNPEGEKAVGEKVVGAKDPCVGANEAILFYYKNYVFCSKP
jgi:hypothetical protein